MTQQKCCIVQLQINETTKRVEVLSEGNVEVSGIANKVKTVFGKKRFNDYIARELRKKNLVRVYKKGTNSSERTAPIAGGYRSNTLDDSTVSQDATTGQEESYKKQSR